MSSKRYNELLTIVQNLIASESVAQMAYVNAMISERLYGTESAATGRAVAQQTLIDIKVELTNAQADLFIHCTADIMAQVAV